jgi:hypothetical protein
MAEVCAPSAPTPCVESTSEVPPALNQFTKTLDKNLAKSEAQTVLIATAVKVKMNLPT